MNEIEQYFMHENNNEQPNIMVSIIIPTYNCGAYLKTAIESVLNQDYRNKEVIVIDGGSKDNTLPILKSYGNKIRWVSEADKGQSDAINKGFSLATGDIVTWLNADDYYEPDILGSVVKEFEASKDIVLVYGKCKSISPQKTIINIPLKNISAELMLWKGNLIYQPASFYRKSSIDKIGKLDISLNFWMEYDLFLKLLKNGEAVFQDKILANFTIRENQKSNKQNLLAMDRELWTINQKNGGRLFSKLFFSIKFHYFLAKIT